MARPIDQSWNGSLKSREPASEEISFLRALGYGSPARSSGIENELGLLLVFRIASSVRPKFVTGYRNLLKNMRDLPAIFLREFSSQIFRSWRRRVVPFGYCSAFHVERLA